MDGVMQSIRNQECRSCGKREAALVRYAGHFMGWFCNDHRPDKVQGGRAIDVLQECYEDSKAPVGKPREVYPIEMNDKKHPFHALCVKRIELGIGCWDKIVTTLIPNQNRAPNRAQRRRR